MRKTIDVFGIKLYVAIVTALLILLVYFGSLTPILLILAIGAIFKVTDEVLSENVVKLGVVYFADEIFDVVIRLFNNITVGALDKLDRLVNPEEYETEFGYELTSRAEDTFFGNFADVMEKIWEVIGGIENLAFVIILVIFAVSLIKSDSIKTFFADKFMDKITAKVFKKAE